MKFYLHKDSLLLQVKASGSKVDNLIDKIKDLKDKEKETAACTMNCIKASGASSGDECAKQCVGADVLCGAACISQVGGFKNFEEMEEVCTTESHPCYKCLDKCASGSGAIAVTSFAIFFSLAISRFMM